MKTKKVLSLLLAVLIACSVFAGLTVSAEETAEHTYTVVGDASFLSAQWNPATPEDHMTKQDDGTYVKEYANVAAGKQIIKVAEDDAWDVSFGATFDNNDNMEFMVEEDNSTVKVILTIDGTKSVEVKNEAGEVTGTKDVTNAYVTVLVNGVAPAAPTEPAETFHVVAGDPTLCNGVNWDPSAEENKMTKLDDGTFTITFTGIAKGEYNFKVTTNGAWDKGDWNLQGDAKFGGPNATINVEEDNSTVKVTFNEADGYANCYINDKLVEVSHEEIPTETKPVATVDDKGNTSDVLYKEGGYYYPSTGVATDRYFFAMPTSWMTFNNAAACAYWWNEPDAAPSWQESYLLRDAGTKVKVGDLEYDVFYIDAAQGIGKIIFSNGIDGGTAPTDETPASPNWGKNFQTTDLSVEGLDPGEDPAYPDGLESYNNMLFIVDEQNPSVNELSGTTTYGGSWFYFHEDSTYDTTKGTQFEVKNEEKVAVTGVELNKTALNLTVGGTDTLTATIAPVEASNKEVEWTTSNAKVATIVPETGKVKAVGAGTATITVKTKDGGFTAACKVTVKAATVKVTKVALSKTKATLYVKKTLTLKATVTPKNATNKAVTWATSNKKVATVSAAGKVTAKAAGKANITATAKDGSKKSAKCAVTVKQYVTKIKLNKTKITVKVKRTYQLKATITPKNASNKAVSWSTKSKKIATVSAKGVVKGVKKGKTVITCTAKDGSKKKATCTVTVKK